MVCKADSLLTCSYSNMVFDGPWAPVQGIDVQSLMYANDFKANRLQAFDLGGLISRHENVSIIVAHSEVLSLSTEFARL